MVSRCFQAYFFLPHCPPPNCLLATHAGHLANCSQEKKGGVAVPRLAWCTSKWQKISFNPLIGDVSRPIFAAHCKLNSKKLNQPSQNPGLLVCLRLSICWSTSSTYEWTIASIYFLFVYLFVCLSLLVYLSLCLFTWLSKCHCINSKYQEQDRTLRNLCREYCANSHQCVRRVRVTC